MHLNNISLFCLRLAISYIWLSAGISKLSNSKFIDSFPATLLNFEKGTHFAFYAGFLKQYVISNAHIFAQLTIWGEILTGAAFFLGFPMSIAALTGIFMNLNYFFVSTSTPSQLLNILMIFSQFAAYATGAGNYWGISMKMNKKF